MATNRESGSTSIYEKVMLATFRCVANSGLSRTTVEEVAQESGVSRSTIYRYFPGGKDELIQSVVAWEAARFFAKLASDISGSDNVVELVERAITIGQQAVESHEVLQKVLQTEPELFIRLFTVEGSRILRLVRGFLMPYLASCELPQGVSLKAAGDYVARMILSHITAPGSWDLSDQAQVHELVTSQILSWVASGGST